MIIPPANRLQQVKEYYFSRKLAEIREMNAQGQRVLNLGIGNPDGMPPKQAINGFQEEITATDVHGYQSYAGLPELKKAMAQFSQWAFGMEVNAVSEILPLIGSKEGITHISLAFLNPGDEVLVPELAYPAYAAVAEMVGAKVIHYPLLETQNYEPDWDFLAQLDTKKVKLMWLNYPHMPTGTRASKPLFQRFISYALQNQLLLCHDNPYGMILTEGQPLSIWKEEGGKDVALELNSMSKSFNMAGWRVGWVIGRPDYIQTILSIKSNVDSGMFKPLMLAATQALEVREEWFKTLNDVYRLRKTKVHALLDVLQCTYTTKQQGLFVWAKIPDAYESSEAFADHWFKEKRIFITPGTVFGEKGDRHVRVSLCVPEAILEEAIMRLK